MRLRKIKHAKNQLAEHPSIVIIDPKTHQGTWQALFEKAQPLHLEVGCGKGKFIMEMADVYQDKNFLALERYDSVLIRVLEKWLKCPKKNVRMIYGNAMDLAMMFGLGEIQTIYLNFSDPWPKRRQEKRRLTHPDYILKYRRILASNGKLILKTDNDRFFTYSMMQINNDDHFRIDRMSLDLKKTSWFNVSTEFEDRFQAQGQPIYYLEATLTEGEPHETTLS
ncbi:MAG: tRNA (guanosine(46)-N7)-methyltransferase TrmB [Candidatus Izemoplasmatales bacterium]|nr:tRNA (guanosine(46)-N7)-methyltransferase TrmB [Candidatus Izemoplasmatales bacterium]